MGTCSLPERHHLAREIPFINPLRSTPKTDIIMDRWGGRPTGGESKLCRGPKNLRRWGRENEDEKIHKKGIY